MIRLLDHSPWKQDDAVTAPLSDNIHCDIAIIGAGVTGLSTALELTERGVDVVVLEQQHVGYGASGRNAGHQASAINEQLIQLKSFVGEEAIRNYLALLAEALAYMSDFIQRYEIDCDHKVSASILAGTSEKHRSKVQAMCKEVQSLGGDVRFVDHDEMRAKDLPRAFDCAMWGYGGTYQPYQYVKGIAERAVQKGARLYEQSPVIDLKETDKIVLTTPNGTVTANKVFLATNAYTPNLPFKTLPKRRILPVYPTMAETEPLTAEQWQRIGWQGKEAICTAHSMIESYHPSAASESIVFGTVAPQIGFRSKQNYVASEKVLAAQEVAFRRRFPMLSDVKVQHGWGGWAALTTNFMPTCAKLASSKNVYYAMAYQGHGVPKATLMGQIASDMMLGKDYKYRTMFTQKALNWPVEPFRYGAFYALAKVSQWMDHRDDPA